MKPSDFVIVIGREFGSGGREIGRLLSRRLGLNYYDKNLLAEAARTFGFDTSVLADADEKRPSFIRSFMGSSFGSASDYGNWGALSPDNLYKVQSEVIGKICSAGSCVIVGRTADYIARDQKNMVSIFIHAPMEHKVKRIIARGDARCEQEAARIARNADGKREDYYNYYTGRRWGHASNYHLSLDASMLSAEESVEIIVRFIEKMAMNLDN